MKILVKFYVAIVLRYTNERSILCHTIIAAVRILRFDSLRADVTLTDKWVVSVCKSDYIQNYMRYKGRLSVAFYAAKICQRMSNLLYLLLGTLKPPELYTDLQILDLSDCPCEYVP